MTCVAFRLAGLALSASLMGTTSAFAQENAECEQRRNAMRTAMTVFGQIGPRLEQLEKTPGAAEQRQLARTGLERATAAESAALRLQALRCLNAQGRPTDWVSSVADARRLKGAFGAAAKRQ